MMCGSSHPVPPATMESSRRDGFIHEHARGSLLLVTLWLITILSVLAVAIARYLSLEIRVTKYRLAREEAKVLARSGVYLAMQKLQQDGADTAEPYDWLGDDWAVLPNGDSKDPTAWIVPVQMGAIRVHITDEERKLSLNGLPPGAPPDTLTRLLEQLGVSQAPELEKRIADYRDGPKEGEDKPEIPYFAKNGDFAVPEELMDLPDMSPALYEKLVPHLTTHIKKSDEKLNLNTVTHEVLSALGLTSGTVQAIEQFRDKPEGRFTDADLSHLANTLETVSQPYHVPAEDRKVLNSAFGVTSQTFRVVSKGMVERPAVHYQVEAIVKRKDCAARLPTCIVGWKEG